MRTRTFLASLLFASLAVAPTASATVNHGDFLGTFADFLQVSETTVTAGDPEPIWEAPTIGVAGMGDQLLFQPTAFISSCAVAGTTDTTTSVLTTTISAQAGNHIEIVSLVEAGDAVLTQFPFPGDPGTNASASMTGTVTVIETTSGPIAPVVINFSGTFVPSNSFALPVNFGNSGWTGSMSVDVLSVVPLATKVELSIDNTLITNCSAAGVPFASMQKKSVSGPTVALLVNPLECELEVDKTCCVTQPVLPDLGKCEGDMVSMTLEYTGGSCRRSNNDQGRSFKCYGRRRLGEPVDITLHDWQGIVQASPMTNIYKGDDVVFTSSTGTMPRKTKIKIKDNWWRKQWLKINTSCNKAFQCDDQFGAFKVKAFESTVQGVVDCSAPPPPPECDPGSGDPVGTQCDAKLVDMVLEYNGQACQTPLGNPQNGEAACSGDATGAVDVNVVYTGNKPYRQMTTPSSGINDGDRVRVTAVWRSGLFPNQEFQISDASGVIQSIDFHVSCSQPLALGDEFGSFKLVEFTTKNGTHKALGSGPVLPTDSCEVPLAPPGPHCTSALEELSLVYIGDFLGQGCTVSNPQGGFATCTGVDDPGDPVDLTVAYGLTIEPDEDVEFGDIVTITPATGDQVLPSFVWFDATGAGGTQGLDIKTNCYKPLSLGDRFGAWVVYGMDRRDDGSITLGGEIQYQYKVTNPGVDQIDNISVDDDQLGNIVSGVSLAGGAMQTFTQNATLLGTTTNVATATGDVGGDVCNPGVDQVTVTVVAPPQSSFSCTEPITEITLVWDGTQTIDFTVWSGNPGVSVNLGSFDDVAPGDTITASGLYGSPTFEIFESDGFTPVGSSVFNLWCDDWSMNGLNDCGKRNGDGKYNLPGLVNDWLLEGMVDDDETMSCTPGVVGSPPDCGFGPELLAILPGLMWMHRRRLRRQQ